MIELAREPDFALGAVQARPALRLFGEETVEPRVMQVLVALCRRIGEVVSRDELIALCWDGRAVSEDAIQRAIAKTRKLGDDSNAFQIETIPRVGYRLSAKSTPAPRAAAPVAAPSAEPLLAVLPFENFSPDAEMSFFADAIADEILQTISRGTKLNVISRATSFQFRGKDKAARHVASELSATHVLDGSVRRAGGSLRISVELIDTASARPVWQETFERSNSDLLAVQDQIAGAVAQTLGRKFQPIPVGNIDPDTYDHYLRARDRISGDVFDPIDFRSIDYITTAAPDFAPGWAMAAGARLQARALWAPEPDRLYDEARAAAEKAKAVDPNNADVLYVLSALEPLCGRAAARIDLLRRSMAAAPGEATSFARLSYGLICAGRLRETFALAAEAYARNPLDPWTAFNYGEALGNSARYDEMLRLHEATERRWPGKTPAAYGIVNYGAARGRWDLVDRYTTPERLAVFPPNNPIVRDMLAVVESYRNPTQERRDQMLGFFRQRIARRGHISLAALGFLARLCDGDSVFELVDAASFAHLWTPYGVLERGDIGFHALFNNNAMVLRADRRFVRLCGRLGLVRYWLDEGIWPDCADEVRYDFREECRRVAEEAPAP